MVVGLYDSLVAGFAELIVHAIHTAVQEQDIESIQLLLDFGCEIDDAGLIVGVEGHDSDLGTWVGGLDGGVGGEVLGGFFNL